MSGKVETLISSFQLYNERPSNACTCTKWHTTRHTNNGFLIHKKIWKSLINTPQMQRWWNPTELQFLVLKPEVIFQVEGKCNLFLSQEYQNCFRNIYLACFLIWNLTLNISRWPFLSFSNSDYLIRKWHSHQSWVFFF